MDFGASLRATIVHGDVCFEPCLGADYTWESSAFNSSMKSVNFILTRDKNLS